MVILSVSVCNKKGKILLARQYVPISRLRIEGLLAAFPKLIASDEESRSKQHTFIETSEVRYIYQPMDTLYLLLITNMQSNILQDLSTLRMIAKLIPEYCGGHDEDTVSENAFNLLYALDEVVTPMGYKDNITYKQIEDFVKMDSAEEKLSEIIEKSKWENAQETMKKKAAEFDKKRADDRKKLGSPGMSSLGYKGLDAIKNWRHSSQNNTSNTNTIDYGDPVNAISSDTYFKNKNQLTGDASGDGNLIIENNDNNNNKKKYFNDSDSDNDNITSKNKKKNKRKENRMGAMKLGMNKKQDALFQDAEDNDIQVLGAEKYKELLKRNKSSNIKEDINDIDIGDLLPIEILISEKLFITFDRDGGLKKFEIKGDMEVAINDPNCTQCVINTNINPLKKIQFGKPIWRLHPRMNSTQWKKGTLCLKDEQKKFRVGRSSKTSILKWRMTTNDDNNVPITIEFWPEYDSSNECFNINAQYNCNINLKNIIIIFPTPTNHNPNIINCDYGNTQFYKREQEFQWILNDISIDNDDTPNEASLEYTVQNVQLEDLYPIYVHFEIEKTYSQIQIKNITSANATNDDEDDQEQFEFNVRGTCVAEKFMLEA